MNSLPSPPLRFLQGIIPKMPLAALLILGLGSCLLLVAQQVSSLRLLDELGFGDSYILSDVRHFQDTGVIYRDLSQPPYLPAQYSPAVYMLYSLAGRAFHWENPFLGPRLIALTAFLLCVATVVSIVSTLIPARSARIWALLLIGTIASMWQWPLQIRGDFPGIFFSLLAIRLLMSRSRWAVLLAGICAGLAIQFKITFVAALAAGSLWLLLRRRWTQVASFVAAGTLVSIGLYLLYWVREPRMIHQILTLIPGVKDLPGCLKLTYQALREPVVLLALLAIPPVASLNSPRWALLLLFALASLSIAMLTDLQAGGNINYFFEGLFALCPAAVLGVFRLTVWARSRVAVSLALTVLLAFYFFMPQVHNSSWLYPPSRFDNATFRLVENALRGRRIFSTVPRLALLDPEPPLVEAYLLSYLQRLGKFDPQPIYERLHNADFDVVITERRPWSWRGVSRLGPDLYNVIVASYRPHCVVINTLFYLPRSRPASVPLATELNRMGCIPVPD